MSAEAIYNVTIALRDRLKAAVTGHGISGNVFVGPPNEVSSGADLMQGAPSEIPPETLGELRIRVVPPDRPRQ